MQHHCLQCGRCAETCPKQVIRKEGLTMNQSERRQFLIQMAFAGKTRHYCDWPVPAG
ncbi:MAG: 4Fe-4S binding protein [Lachnospiraceae bacterium]